MRFGRDELAKQGARWIVLIFFVTGDIDVINECGSGRRAAQCIVQPTPALIAGQSTLGRGSAKQREYRLLAPANGDVDVDRAYFATATELQDLTLGLRRAGIRERVRLLGSTAANVALQRLGAPPRLGYVRASGLPFVPLARQLEELEQRPRSLHLAIVNVYHVHYGDALVFLSALRVLRNYLSDAFTDVVIDLLQTPYNTEIEALYERSGLVERVRDLPLPLSIIREYDAYFDLSIEYVDDTLPWIDGILQSLGIRADGVSAADKRVLLPAMPPVSEEVARVIANARASATSILLFHPSASTPIRSFPDRAIAAVLDAILARTSWLVACAVPIAYRHERLIDWSAVSSSFDRFTHLLAHVDGVLSADTIAYHVADALDIPGVVVFTSILPERRVTYYPHITGIALDRATPLLGAHWSHDPHEIAAAIALWDRLDVDELLTALRAAMQTPRVATK